MAVSIVGIAGNVLTVTGYDGATPIQRLQQGTVDVKIEKSTATTLTVSDATGLVGGAATLWDLDVMETRTVTALKNGRATLASPLSAVPADYAGYIYQSTTKKAKLVRIKSMKKQIGEQRYSLTAVDYTDDTYLIPPPTGIGS